MSLRGKTALVTGSTSGIGLGIAEAFAAEGVNVMLNGFGDAAEIEKLRAGLAEKHGVGVAYAPADVSHVVEVEQMVRKTEAEFGALDILVNNAGVQFVANIEDFPAARWDWIISINLSAAFHAMHFAIPGMRARKWGRIINIASAHGLVASAQKSAYVAAKHGIVGLTKVAALELANSGVTANAICPGWVLTPLVEKQLAARAEQEHISMADAEHEFLVEKQPLLQFSTPEHLGALAVFLSSDAACTMTGVALPMDGGWTAR